MAVISAIDVVNFKYDKQAFGMPTAEACGFAKAVVTAGKVTECFTHTVVSRTTVILKTDGNLDHTLKSIGYEDPLLPHEFLRMMQFPLNISNDAWVEKMKENISEILHSRQGEGSNSNPAPDIVETVYGC